jgi:hypothetical protein
MKRLVREPLAHFVLLGAALFAVSHIVNKRAGNVPGTVVVTHGQIEHLAAGFARTWQRPPSTEELDGLISGYIREEVYVREAMAMGLDRDDAVIRRRLQQKLEFISDDVAALAEPSDEDLAAFIQAHPDTFRVERRFTFRHVYLDPQRHRSSLGRDAAELLTRLKDGVAKADVSVRGDPFLLAHEFDAVPNSEIRMQFGDAFARALNELRLGEWQGPVESGYGAHLVLVSERTEGRIPALQEIRDAVRREWANAQRLQGDGKFYRALLARYTVTFEPPVAITGNNEVAAAKWQPSSSR